MSVNNKILEVAKAKKISHEKIAQKLGIARPNLTRLLNGSDLKVSTLLEISKILDIDPAYLISNDIETLTDAYKRLIDELITSIIAITDDYTGFVQLLELFCTSNPKARKEINNYVKKLYDKNIIKSQEKYHKNLTEKQKRLNDLMGDKSIKAGVKEFITKETPKEVVKYLKDNLSNAEALIKAITDLDKNFDISTIESLYADFINPKLKSK